MAQRRPPTDSEPFEVTDAQIKAVMRYLESITALESQVIAHLYGPLPAWMPEPELPRSRQAIASMKNTNPSPESITEFVKRVRTGDEIEVPGGVLDSTDFPKSVHYLAHVQWALGKNKATAIKELAGSGAAQNYLRNKSGNEAQYATEAELQSRNREIYLQAADLRKQNKKLKDYGIAKRLAPTFDLSTKQLYRILRAQEVTKK